MRVVTIARDYGSCGEELASSLAARLGWDVADHSIVECTARELGERLEVAEARDECTTAEIASQVLGAIRIIDPLFMTMAGAQSESLLSTAAYHRTADQIIRAAATRGKMVIVGRASQVILADRLDVLHVRVVAPFALRVENVMQRDGVTRHTAERCIRRNDRERTRYLEREYHHRTDQEQLYDLVVNTSRLDVESAVDIICFTLHQVGARRWA
jgi:cytidylate kinase